jgi:hypothetical protein
MSKNSCANFLSEVRGELPEPTRNTLWERQDVWGHVLVKILPFRYGDTRRISSIFSSSGFTFAVVSIEILSGHPRFY